MRKTLTDRLVKAKAPGAPVIWDAALTGFGMRVGKTGRSYFIQSRVGGDLFKMKVSRVQMTDKDTAALSLANARKKAGELLAMAQAGDDPRKIAAKAKQAATLAKLNSFANVAAGYMEEHGRFLRSGAELARKLEVDVLPAFGHRPIAEITRGEIKDLFLRKAQTAPVAANRMLALIRLVFNFALDEEILTASPVARIKPRPEASRERCLDAGEIAPFWNGLPETGAPLPVQRALKFILTTLQRPGEVLGLRWDEIDLAEAIWTLPAGRTKSARASLVPLTGLAIGLLGEPGDGYVFANGGGQPFTRSSTSRAMQALCSNLEIDRATPHDLRRSAATGLGALQIDRLIISKILNHVDAGITGTTYDLHDRLPQKRLALEAWSARLQEITSGTSAPSNVEPLKRAAQ